MLGMSLRDRVRNEVIRQRTGIADITHRAAALKWRWAGHIARSSNEKWTKRLLTWRPRTTTRSAGRPQMRWKDDLSRRTGVNWIQAAQDRMVWKSMEEAFVQEWTAYG